jgi:hypothetical protein
MIAQQLHPRRNACSKPKVPQPTAAEEATLAISCRLCALRPLCGHPYQSEEGPEPATRLVRAVEPDRTGESTL